MKKILLLLLLFPLPAIAVDRAAYVAEAGAEFSFYLNFAAGEPSFLKQLGAAEKEQFQGILAVAMKLPSGPKFIFSDKPSDFILSPGEPERSAKTTEVLTDPIWINTRKLNGDSPQIDYLSVIQLLVHELGHKLGARKNQSAVDSFATKLRAYLAAYYVKEPVYLELSIDPPRPMPESFEFLSLPKKVGEKNPNPSFFYLSRTKAWPIRLHFEESLKKQNQEKFVRVHRTLGLLDSGAIQAKVSLSVYKQFVVDGRKIYAQEGSYEISEPMPFLSEGPYDGNFKMSRLALSYPQAPIEQAVRSVKQVSRDAKAVVWDVAFTADQAPLSTSLVAGTRNRPFLVPCTKPQSSSGQYLVRCTLAIGTHAAISILDIFQLLVDGRTLDLSELIQLDLEMDFKLRFELSDTAPKKIQTVSNAYHLTMEGTFFPIQVRVRCLEEKPFFYGSRRLGTITAFTEQVFFQDALPITKNSGKQYTLQGSCAGGRSMPVEILVTDGLYYTSNPKW